MMTNTFFCFSQGAFYCDTTGPLTQADVTATWASLPTTGCAWLAGGHLWVQERADGIEYDLGEVAAEVVQVRG